MKDLKQSFVYKRARKTYRKARKAVLDKGKNLENSLIGYLESEVAPSISVARFSNDIIEKEYYAKIASLKNIYAMLIEFEKNNTFSSDNEKAYKLVAIGKVVDGKYSDTRLRYLIAYLALNMHEDTFTLSGFIWACIHSNRYEEAAITLNYFAKSDFVDSQQTESLKRALTIRLPKENIDDYLKKYSQSKYRTNKNELKDELLQQESEYVRLYKKQDFKAIADIIFSKFKGSNNVDEVMSFINLELKVSNKFSTKAILLIIINIGKKFSEYGKRDLDIDLVEEALKIKKYPMTVRSAFWAYYKQGNINKSREMLDWLEDYAKVNNDRKLLEFVQLKRQTYLFIDTLYLQGLIVEAQKFNVSNYEPIPNSIAYVLHNTLPYASGGYATRGHGLAEAVKDKGYGIKIVGRPGFPLDIRRELTAKDVERNQLIDGLEYTFTLYPRRDETSVQDFIEKAADELFKKFLELKPAIVVAASNHLTGLPALIAARKLGIPFIYEVRGFWEITRISREPEFEHTEFYKRLCELESLVATNAEHVFTLTTPMQEELVSRGVDIERITILPNSCDPSRFEPVPRNTELAHNLDIPGHIPVIGYIGTFVQYEGLEHLAEACGLLKQRGVEFRLLIVGNENTAGESQGAIGEEIEFIAKKYKFEDWLIMTGRIPHEEVEAYYSLIDIAPFPRKPQPVTEMVSPMKPLEAAAMKKAIVVSSVKALTDMIKDGENGLVYEKGDIENLSDKLHSLIINEDLRSELGNNARLWVENDRTWEKTAEKFDEKVSFILSNK